MRFDGGTGDDRLVFAGGQATSIRHEATGIGAGILTVDGARFAYSGVETVDFAGIASAQTTIELANDANATLTQATDGSLLTSIQYAFDAQTDLAALDGSDGFSVSGATVAGLGHSVSAGAGDVNQDGAGDLIVGAPGADVNGADSGQAYVLFGMELTAVDDGFDAVIEAAALDGSAGFLFNGGAAGGLAGSAVGGGADLNADGVDDPFIGAPASAAGGQAGAAQVVFGDAQLGAGAPIDLGALDGVNGFTAATATPTTTAADLLGTAVAAAGDIDGDGIDDLIIGAPANGGAASVLFGRIAGGAVSTTSYALPAAAFSIEGSAAAARITIGAAATPTPVGGTTVSSTLNFDGADFSASGSAVTVVANAIIFTRHIVAGDDPATADSIGDSGDIVL